MLWFGKTKVVLGLILESVEAIQHQNLDYKAPRSVGCVATLDRIDSYLAHWFFVCGLADLAVLRPAVYIILLCLIQHLHTCHIIAKANTAQVDANYDSLRNTETKQLSQLSI